MNEHNKHALSAFLGRDRAYIPTGIGPLDTKLDGYYPGTVIVVGGWPGTGKTTLTINLVSRLKGRRVSVFTTNEIGKERFLEKMMCSLVGVKDKDIRMGQPEAIQRIGDNLHLLDNYDINVVDKAAPDLKDIENELKDRQPHVMIIDYFQNLALPENVVSRYAAFTNLARNLEKLVKKHSTTLILNSQLRKPEDVNMRPTLFDFKETGKLGEMAHAAILLSSNSGEREEGEMYVEVVKARDGKLGSFTLKGDWDTNKL